MHEPYIADGRYKLKPEHGVVVALATLALRGRRLATTAKGRLALVPESAVRGDVVAVLYSVNFPGRAPPAPRYS